MGDHTLSVLLCLSVMCTAAIADDGEYMLKLAKALKPTPSGWSGTNFCDWNGVHCIGSNHVIQIAINSQSLTGTLPPGLNSLSQLFMLTVQNNALSGALPSLANLFSLVVVHLDGNNFTSVPDGCFQGLTRLAFLTMNDNINLAPWTFPIDLTQSSELAVLGLGNVNLVGSLPDVFDSFEILQELDLSYNNLTGELPKTFGVSFIEDLWLHNQNHGFGFSGSIQVLSTMTQLSQVWLNKNQFTGPIPDLSKCSALFDLQLHGNQLTGVVPTSLISHSRLQNVSLDNNLLQGPVPLFMKGVKTTLSGINTFCMENVGPCDSRVTTLLDIAKDFGYPLLLARSWTGNDPCRNWSFIVCEEEKIIRVNLVNQNLNGTISPSFANLTNLKNLYVTRKTSENGSAVKVNKNEGHVGRMQQREATRKSTRAHKENVHLRDFIH